MVPREVGKLEDAALLPINRGPGWGSGRAWGVNEKAGADGGVRCAPRPPSKEAQDREKNEKLVCK